MFLAGGTQQLPVETLLPRMKYGSNAGKDVDRTIMFAEYYKSKISRLASGIPDIYATVDERGHIRAGLLNVMIHHTRFSVNYQTTIVN